MTLTDDPTVLALWWIALVLTAVAIVPAALYLLQRTLRAAASIRRFTEEALAAGAGIAENTEKAAALEETVAAAGPIAEKIGQLRALAAELERTLKERAP